MNILEKIGITSFNQTLDDWMVQVFIVVLVALIINFFLKRLINKLADKAGRSKNPWDDAFILALNKPIRLLVWVIGITFATAIRLFTAFAIPGWASNVVGSMTIILVQSLVVSIFSASSPTAFTPESPSAS